MERIDTIIVSLNIAEQLGASVTIIKEDVPFLLAALEPEIQKQADYWQDLNKRVKRFNMPKEVQNERNTF